MNLELIASFVQKSGLRKVGSGLSMFAALAWLLYVKALPAENFTSLGMVIIVTLMGANSIEHLTKNKKEKPDASPAPAAPPSPAPAA